MARKDKTPPPPRRVQAPRPRPAERRPVDRRAFALVGAGGLALIVAGVAIAMFAFGGNGPGDARAQLEAAGCTLEEHPAQSAKHVTELPKGFKHNSDPPTSGPHHPQPAPFDIYPEPVEQLRLVHNLEHGGVVIQYGDKVPQASVDALIDWYRDSPNGIVIAPRPKLGDKIALAAWTATVSATGDVKSQKGVLAKCPRFDKKAFDAFMKAYAFKGPERFPEEALAPGQ